MTEDKLEKYGAEVIKVLQKYSEWQLPGRRTFIFIIIRFFYLCVCVVYTVRIFFFSVVDEQTESAGNGWIDTRRSEDDDIESSTYFSNQSAQGQKRKKAPFFKYSKKMKAYGNQGYSSKGYVES